MKKTYEKPQVYIETFTLAEHIAGCYFTLNIADVNSCSGNGEVDGFPVESLFLAKPICENPTEGYCYTNSAIDVSTITS